ncbi:hypothetical protein ACVDG5_018340 [Mesorhizobium sp. ORM6]
MAETKIDDHFATKINAILGPMAALHARKRVLAAADLIDDKADQAAILDRSAEQDAVLLAIDEERRALKAKIRAAANSHEIKAIVAEATGTLA